MLFQKYHPEIIRDRADLARITAEEQARDRADRTDPMRADMRHYRMHHLDGSTTSFDAHDLVQALKIARVLVLDGITPDYHAVEAL